MLNRLLQTRSVSYQSIFSQGGDFATETQSGVTINGNTAIGSGCFIGSGSIVKEGASLGKNCLIGMGLAVRHNLPDNTKFARHKTP
jgi:acetyltransferase-like isoleucine patch superfamily enzyme